MADIFFASASAGSNNGTSCANARALSSHVIGDDVAGNILHLCPGSYSPAGSAFKFLASGTAGNVITLKGEAGGVTFTNPGWSTAAIDLNGQSFVTVDGGVT